MKVFVARNPTEAHLVRGMLEAAGIEAEVRGESLWGTRGETPLDDDTLPSVWCSTKVRRRRRSVLSRNTPLESRRSYR